jgi:hypothetical protein
MTRFLLHLWTPTLHRIELINDHMTLASYNQAIY